MAQREPLGLAVRMVRSSRVVLPSGDLSVGGSGHVCTVQLGSTNPHDHCRWGCVTRGQCFVLVMTLWYWVSLWVSLWHQEASGEPGVPQGHAEPRYEQNGHGGALPEEQSRGAEWEFAFSC